MNFRLDFVSTIKIFFSLELCFRIFQSGITQPLKAALFLRRWQPSWLIYVVKYFGDIVTNASLSTYDAKSNEDYWLTKEIICRVPLHLDITAIFGIAIFIVMSNSTR